MIKTKTSLQLKYEQNKRKLAAKKEQRKYESLDEKELKRVADCLTTTALALTVVNFETKKLQKMGLLENRSLIIDANTEFEKLGSFFENMAKNNGDIQTYEVSRNNFDDFIFRWVHSTPEEKDRTIKFLESIQNKRK
ncbi:hypothetical protein HZP39_04105 [Elizabethkingia anophelis]|nr:hypothetical protein [Elizabethkingia anophelis]MCT4239408.1 hypothetical protein [Elizabethkingia anophelis]MCT4282021.1 hypothetical protein [Elizabethkingia anophelis]MCT4292606.1 hypothetical protein [Elizabethkingia anophelis]